MILSPKIKNFPRKRACFKRNYIDWILKALMESWWEKQPTFWDDVSQKNRTAMLCSTHFFRNVFFFPDQAPKAAEAIHNIHLYWSADESPLALPPTATATGFPTYLTSNISDNLPGIHHTSVLNNSQQPFQVMKILFQRKSPDISKMSSKIYHALACKAVPIFKASSGFLPASEAIVPNRIFQHLELALVFMWPLWLFIEH